jgi:hypothetical protein
MLLHFYAATLLRRYTSTLLRCYSADRFASAFKDIIQDVKANSSFLATSAGNKCNVYIAAKKMQQASKI